jgi:hypothetical protein
MEVLQVMATVLPATVEYIALKGGPHPNPDGMIPYSTQFTGSNYYETAKNRENNLKYDLQNKGVTVEFWLKKAPSIPPRLKKRLFMTCTMVAQKKPMITDGLLLSYQPLLPVFRAKTAPADSTPFLLPCFPVMLELPPPPSARLH